MEDVKDLNRVRRMVSGLVEVYDGVGFDSRVSYDEFSMLFNELEDLGYEVVNEYELGIEELVEGKGISENKEDVEKIGKGLVMCVKCEEL